MAEETKQKPEVGTREWQVAVRKAVATYWEEADREWKAWIDRYVAFQGWKVGDEYR